MFAILERAWPPRIPFKVLKTTEVVIERKFETVAP
jgi:hypothetical protein